MTETHEEERKNIKSMQTGTGGPLSSAASTDYGLGWVGDIRVATSVCCQVAKRKGPTQDGVQEVGDGLVQETHTRNTRQRDGKDPG